MANNSKLSKKYGGASDLEWQLFSWVLRLSQWCNCRFWSSGMPCCIIWWVNPSWSTWPFRRQEQSHPQQCTITSQTIRIRSLPDTSTDSFFYVWNPCADLTACFTNTAIWIFKIFIWLKTQHPAMSYQLANTVVLQITHHLGFTLLTHFANWILFARSEVLTV
jgi:hypothetical protein